MSKNPSKKSHKIKVSQNDLTYLLNEDDKTASVIGSESTQPDIIIPRCVFHGTQEYIVTSITENSFNNSKCIKTLAFETGSEVQVIGKKAFYQSTIESITIPPHLTKICEGAFNFSRLEHIEIPSDSELQIIEEKAFFSASIESIEIPSKLTQLKRGWCSGLEDTSRIIVSQSNPNYRLYDDKFIISKSSKEKEEENQNFDVLVFCVRDIEKVTIPSFIEIIDKYAFDHCKIKSIEIPPDSKLRIIGNNSFLESKIEEISIPASVTKIGKNAFQYCHDLKKVEIPEHSKLSVIGKNAFEMSRIESFFIPCNVKCIDEYTFSNCEKLQNVEIYNDSKLEIIGKYAFHSSLIQKFSLPPSVTTIGQYSFESCKKLTNFEIPPDSNLQVIENCAFQDTIIEKIEIPSSVVKLEDKWCVKMPSLKEVIIDPDNQNYFSLDNVFIFGKTSTTEDFDVFVFSVESLKGVNMPSFVKIIGPNAFEKCKKMNEIIFPSDTEIQIIDNNSLSNCYIQQITIPASLIRIGKEAFSKCMFLRNVEIPIDSQLEIIDDSAFSGAHINSIFIPSHVKRIGIAAFQRSLLKEIKFSENSELQIIDNMAFEYIKIERISIPSSVQRIGWLTFKDCSNLKEVTIPQNSELQIIEEKAFTDTKIESFTIPSKLIELKKGWCAKMPLLNDIFVDSNNKRYSLYDNKFIIGKSSIEKDGFDVLVCCVKNIKNVTIPDFIEIIEQNAFSDCSMIREITFPPKLKCIGQKVFEHCKNLKKVNFSENSELESIENEAFYKTAIECISIPSHVTKIYKRSFSGLNNLQIVEIDDNSELELIDEDIFSYLNNVILMVPVKFRFNFGWIITENSDVTVIFDGNKK